MARRGDLRVRITGLDRLRTKLDELPEEIREALRRAIRESAEAVREDTRRNVAVDTGNLRNSLEVTYEDSGLTAKVGWFDDDDYYARYLEFGTRSQPAQPALMPALEEERRRIGKRVTDEVRRHLR